MSLLISLTMLFNYSLVDFRTEVYRSYIDSDIESWEYAISRAEYNNAVDHVGFSYHYALACYGLAGHYIGKGNEDKAEIYLDKAISATDEILALSSNDSKGLALRGALYGLEIAISNYKAVYLGPRSLDFIEKALLLNPENPTAWIEHGNALYYMPSVFGGDKAKARNAYRKAIRLFEQKGETNCWLYINSMSILGTWYVESGRYNEAKFLYDKVMALAPGFQWVRDELLPELLTKIST